MSENNLIIRNMKDVHNAAIAMAGSKYFEDAAEAAQAMVKIMAGYEIGVGPFASMTGIHIIKGKPTFGANIMAAKVKAHPNYHFKVNKLDNEGCEIEFFELWNGKWQSAGISAFTAQDAVKAQTGNTQKFPRNMYFARAMSNGVKWYCPDVFTGSPVYTPDELGAIVEKDDNVIEVVPEPETSEELEPTPVYKPWMLEIVNSNGERYVDLSLEQLAKHEIGINKGLLKEDITPEQADIYNKKLLVIEAVRNAQE